MTNPFKLLDWYKPGERLYGRDGDLVLISSRILSARTTLLFAGSGVGKTSFLQAKLIPALERDFVVVSHRQWSGKRPAADLRHALLAAHGVLPTDRLRARRALREWFGAVTPAATKGRDAVSLLMDDTPAAKPVVLILDQFEELFQHPLGEREYLKCIGKLAWLIRTMPVRVVIAMREEFLGELSVFDNRLPDVFANYYRLKHPNRDDAGSIIRLTVESAGHKVDNDRLRDLVRDLSRVQALPVGGAVDAAGSIARNIVPPPFLQIVCYRLWDREATAEAERNKQAEKDATPAPFASSYKGGDASRELAGFCDDQIKGLGVWRRFVGSRAFEFLVTRRGAKAAYDLKRLSRQLWLPKAWVRPTLERLTSRRILRAWDVDDQRWYELYHDIFGPAMQRWSDTSRSVRRGVAGLMLPILGFFALLYADGLRRDENLAILNQQPPVAVPVARQAYQRLGTLRFRTVNADEPWAAYWERKAHLATKSQDRVLALLSWIESINAAPATKEAPRRRQEAALLAGTDAAVVLSRYRSTTPIDRTISSSSDESILVSAAGQPLKLWDVRTGVVTDLPREWEGMERSPVPPTTASSTEQRGPAPPPGSVEVGARAPFVLAFGTNATLKTHLFLARIWDPRKREVGSRLRDGAGLWDEKGRELRANPPLPSEESGIPRLPRPGADVPSPRIGISQDTNFVALAEKGELRIWSLANGAASGVGDVPGTARRTGRWAFGAGRLFTTTESPTRGSIVRQFSLQRADDTRPARLEFLCETMPVPGRVVQVWPGREATANFSVMTSRGLFARWSGRDCKSAGESKTMTLPTFTNMALRADDRSLVTISGFGGELTTWDLEANKQLGRAVLPTPAESFNGIPYRLLSSGQVVLDSRGGELAALDVDAVLGASSTGHDWTAFSSDGKLALALSDTHTQLFDLDTLQPIGQPLEVREPEVDRIIARDRFIVTTQLTGPTIIVSDVVEGTSWTASGDGAWVDPTGRSLLVMQGPASRRSIALYGLANKRQVLLGKVTRPRDPVFSPYGMYVSVAGLDNAVHVWRTSDGREIVLPEDISEESPDPPQVAFGAGDRIAVARGGKVFVESLTGGTGLSVTIRRSARVSALRFARDGQSLVIGTVEGDVQFWDTSKKETVGTDSHGEPITDLVLSVDGRRVAVRAADWVHVYDLVPSFAYSASRYVTDAAVLLPHGPNDFAYRARNGRLFSLFTISLGTAPELADADRAAWVRRLGVRLNDAGEAEPLSAGTAGTAGAVRQR